MVRSQKTSIIQSTTRLKEVKILITIFNDAYGFNVYDPNGLLHEIKPFCENINLIKAHIGQFLKQNDYSISYDQSSKI